VTGEIEQKGTNVVVVTPEAPAAGYVEADIIDIKLIEGMTTSTIGYRIVDPSKFWISILIELVLKIP
jgi:hypothetical protein